MVGPLPNRTHRHLLPLTTCCYTHSPAHLRRPLLPTAAAAYYLPLTLDLLLTTGLFQPQQKRVSEAAAPVNAAAAARRFANAERRALHICKCENDVQAGCDPACERASTL
jgi:hypothetical protein